MVARCVAMGTSSPITRMDMSATTNMTTWSLSVSNSRGATVGVIAHEMLQVSKEYAAAFVSHPLSRQGTLQFSASNTHDAVRRVQDACDRVLELLEGVGSEISVSTSVEATLVRQCC